MYFRLGLEAGRAAVRNQQFNPLSYTVGALDYIAQEVAARHLSGESAQLFGLGFARGAYSEAIGRQPFALSTVPAQERDEVL